MFKPSRRAVVIAASFALGLSAVGPAAHAGLLGGSDSDTAIEGVPLPVAGDLLEGDGLLGGLLGDGLLGDNLLSGLLGGEGLPLVGALLSDDGLLGGGLLGGGLPLVGDVLGGGLPLVGELGLVDGLLNDGESVLAAEGLVEIVGGLPLDVVPGLGSVSEILEAFSDSGSIVPGLQVLDEMGILGILGSM